MLNINDLSPFLEHEDWENCLMLINKIVNHLLWADDLIILSLDRTTLQKKLNSLSYFCTPGGLTSTLLKLNLLCLTRASGTQSQFHSDKVASLSQRHRNIQKLKIHRS